MNSAEFSAIAESLYFSIEDALDAIIDNDIASLDYENSGSVITIDCEDSHTKVIVTRQQATNEIWVAAKSGGFHCQYDESLWHCKTTGETLEDLLSRVCSEQSNTAIQLEGIN